MLVAGRILACMVPAGADWRHLCKQDEIIPHAWIRLQEKWSFMVILSFLFVCPELGRIMGL
jgi:hypothetical protein